MSFVAFGPYYCPMGGIQTWQRDHAAQTDWVLAFATFLLALAEVRWGDFSSVLLPLLLVAAATLPVGFRRQRPVLAATIPYLMVVPLEILGGVPGGVVLSTILVFHSLGLHGDLRIANIRRFWLLVPFAVTVVTGLVLGFSRLDTLLFFLIINPGIWAFSNNIRKWRHDQEELRQQNILLQEREADRVHAAVLEERTTIARELHDIIAHNVSVIAIQAGAAQRVSSSSSRQVTEALEAIEESARQALTEMRLALGVMRGDKELLEPQPNLAGVEDLVDTVRRAGLNVDLQITGTQRPIPPAIELSSYRIIQEALTNTLKHGGLGASSEVELTYLADKLMIDVNDTGLGHPQEVSKGHGLIGIGERVALFGGHMNYGNREERGFFVHAELPLMVNA